MSRQSTPDARIRSFVERICRLKAEQDDLQLDIQAVYLEAKKDNLDKTALGQVVSIVRKREKNREKFEEAANVVEMYLAAVDGHGSHAYAPVPRKPAARQEQFGPATGEVHEKGEVRAEQSALTPAETSSSEALCEHGAGAPLHPMDPAPQSIEPAPGCMADPSPQDDALAAMLEAARDHVMTDADREAQARSFAYGNAAIDNPLVTRAMVASAPYRVTDPAPAPVAVDPDMSPLVADAAARQAAARKLLGQEAGE